MKKKDNELLQFLVGLVMLVVGIYIFSQKVVVSTNFFGGWMIGSFNMSGGLVVIPMIIGVIWWFISPDSIWAKIVTGLGFVLIVVSVIMNTRFYFHDSLFNYILMLVLMAGGIGLILKVLLKNRKNDKDSDKKTK